MPGYFIRNCDTDIGRMDYRTMRSQFCLPPEGDPDRQLVLLATAILATFSDSVNARD